jgi:GTP-binding protein
MFVNDAEAFGKDYQRYLINRMHEVLPFKEVPIRLFIRERGDKVE